MLTDNQRITLDRHLSLVLAANERTNITRITSPERARLLHVEDSLVGVTEVEDCIPGPLVDIGSGAGYPGIPLAVATAKKTTLVESVGKKASLLHEFVNELGLNDLVEVYAGRSEALARDLGAHFAVATARALSSLPSLMELASPLLMEDGRLVCYKADDFDEELSSAMTLQEKLAMRFQSRRDVILSDGVTKRSIVVFTKKGTPLVNLPRHEGQAQRKPYKR